MNMKEIWQCCICGEYFTGWGNNPWPVSNDEDDKCCDYCNFTKVLPERIAMLGMRKENQNGEQ